MMNPAISDDLPHRIKETLCASRRLTTRELYAIFHEVSGDRIHEAMTATLGYRKLCARWLAQVGGGELL